MRQLELTILAALVTLLAMPGAPVPAAPDPTTLSIRLQGFEEPPAISTTGTGRFRIQISKNLAYVNVHTTLRPGGEIRGQRERRRRRDD